MHGWTATEAPEATGRASDEIVQGALCFLHAPSLVALLFPYILLCSRFSNLGPPHRHPLAVARVDGGA